MIDKQEFMAVSGMNRMAYNDQYIIGQRGDEFILYKFGDESMRVYNTEFEMQQDLNELGKFTTKTRKCLSIGNYCIRNIF